MLVTYEGLVAEVLRLQRRRVFFKSRGVNSAAYKAACEAERKARRLLAKTPEQGAAVGAWRRRVAKNAKRKQAPIVPVLFTDRGGGGNAA